MLSARSLGIPEVSAFVKNDHTSEDDVARGGVADVYFGLFQQTGAPPLKVAIKTIRIETHTHDSASLAKPRRKLNRELGIWRTLQGESEHPNLLRLVGVIDSPDGMPSSVSEYCVATLAEYLVNPLYKPHRVELLVGTLRGLAHIHSFSIVHGDLKGLNVLVAEDGTPKICDFGHSRFVGDSAQPVVSDLSSKFHATTRYMSPELFTDPKSKPTLASDIWAFGCVALEVLSQLRPYHVITNEHRVTLAIKSGQTPSTKPEYPYAASCLTDMLWDVIKKCWHPHQLSRPTSTSLLYSINDLIEMGQLDPSTSTPSRPANELDGELLNWPEGLEDFAETLSGLDKNKISVRRMADVWLYSQHVLPNVTSSFRPVTSRMFAVKVLRAPGGLGSDDSTVDPFQQALRRVVRERLSIKHHHIIGLLGIDMSCGKYPGLVMEFCGGGNLNDALNAADIGDELFPVRCMIQILKGLEFLHNLPSPLAHGDLTPHNILADSKGTLKLTLISFARLSANLPTHTQTAAPNDDAISARYLSPELVAKDDGSWPTPHADMWSFGCVACWMYVKIDPYPECRSEHEVISNIIDGLPPFSVSQLSRIGLLGRPEVMPSAPWMTNGTLAAILRCWNQDGNRRPTATACLSDLAELLDQEIHKQVPISPDVPDLAGKVTTPDHPKKKILGYFQGTWRRAFNYRSTGVIVFDYQWWRGLYSPGFFRRSVEVDVKGIRLPPFANAGGFVDAAKQSIHHEIALLRQLKHENICRFLGYDITHGGTVTRLRVPAILTEFCSNGTLGEYCCRNSGDHGFQDRIKLVSWYMRTPGSVPRQQLRLIPRSRCKAFRMPFLICMTSSQLAQLLTAISQWIQSLLITKGS
ncbi:hypothetical protein FS749_016135 [Ceratobasidium sp. UAMH 11750]|nr:hypothetical protein FS749_016135 [Ceratobasidium sp. UAMH 11750]